MAGYFSDVIRIAREIHEAVELHEPSHGKDLDKGGELVIKVHPDLREYVQGILREAHGNPAYSVDYTDAVCHPFTYGLSQDHVGSGQARYSVSSSLTYCWKRFVATKELMHILTGSYTDVMTTGLVQDAANSRTAYPEGNHKLLTAELFCQCIAIEVLLPWKLRTQVSTEFIDSGFDHKAVAEQTRVPTSIIKYFSDPRYFLLSKKENERYQG